MLARRVRNAAMVALAAVALTASVSPSGAQAAAGDGKVGLPNYASNMAMQPSGTGSGAYLYQKTSIFSGTTGDWTAIQNWKKTAVSGVTRGYRFVNASTGMALGVDGASMSTGAAIIQATPSTATNQIWILTPKSGTSNIFQMKNGKSGLCIGVTGASQTSGARLYQFTCDGTANQYWGNLDF
jgi:hypothetical protein